jgi:hypothetical protein
MNSAASPTEAFSRTKIRDAFIEFFVHFQDGSIKTFDQREMSKVGECIRDAPKPVKVERAIYPRGDGVRAIRHQWKRREKIVFERPLSHFWVVDEISHSRAQVIADACELAEDGMPHKIIFAAFGVHPASLARHCKKVGVEFQNVTKLRMAH